MCLIAFSYRQHPRYRLVVVANRDEFYERPTAAADWWSDQPQLLAGRDLEAGGTWMGITRAGRWAALTNYREPQNIQPDAPSRGALVVDFLQSEQPTASFLDQRQVAVQAFNGFNLLADDGVHLGYLSNRASAPRLLEPGTYGLSNHLLDTPWPKVVQVREQLRETVATSQDLNVAALMPLLADTRLAPDQDLPQTGVSLDLERMLSAVCIQSPNYGTRVSTVVLVGYDGQVTFVEKGHLTGETQRHTFSLQPSPSV